MNQRSLPRGPKGALGSLSFGPVKMRLAFEFAWLATVAAGSLQSLCAQDLSPRAYLITPVQANVITLTWSFYDGSIDFNGVVPATGATGTYSVPILACYHSFGLFGRSANVVASLPYGVGNFRGTVAGAGEHLYRSGLLDSVYRISVNLKGGPALPAQQFAKWRQKVLLGASLKVIAPTGQHDATKLINWGANRWAFKPEFGYSQRWSGKWILDGYAGVWLFTTNPEFWSRNIYYPGTRSQSQSPVGSFEGHLSYNFKPRLWASLDGNYWFGGKTSLNGIETPLPGSQTRVSEAPSRSPLTAHQALKFSYSDGTYIRYGGNYHNVQIAWQYSWVGRPK